MNCLKYNSSLYNPKRVNTLKKQPTNLRCLLFLFSFFPINFFIYIYIYVCVHISSEQIILKRSLKKSEVLNNSLCVQFNPTSRKPTISKFYIAVFEMRKLQPPDVVRGKE